MTIKELSQLYWLNREIEADQHRLEELKIQAQSVSSPNMNGSPRRGSQEASRIEACVAEIIDMQAIISAKQQQCIYEKSRLERYIASIPDSLTRMIFTYRFINGLSWLQVAHHVGGNSEDSVKKICYRFLKSQSKQ